MRNVLIEKHTSSTIIDDNFIYNQKEFCGSVAEQRIFQYHEFQIIFFGIWIIQDLNTNQEFLNIMLVREGIGKMLKLKNCKQTFRNFKNDDYCLFLYKESESALHNVYVSNILKKNK